MIVGRARAMGDLTVGQLQSDFETKVFAPLAAKFNVPLNRSQFYRLLQPELERAQKFQAIDPPAPATLAVRVAALQRIRNAAKLAYDAEKPDAPVPADERIAGREAVLDILRWLAGVSGQALSASNQRAQSIKNIAQAFKDAPKEILSWGLESLGLPKWALPVALVGAGVVVVGHLSGGLRALIPQRANPGRRRHR